MMDTEGRGGGGAGMQTASAGPAYTGRIVTT